ncbi:hypothetical protein HPB51_008687 [Rhipicephalus microplus]|uniref:Uncharacterized protein n=1 Tax=Rhipicephalus microplus TaxID=6941 RepID=A0A9J6EZF5_RHIMP|nr:hypothetical protein HPB51_008687 [Rhipicephalus microplus]
MLSCLATIGVSMMLPDSWSNFEAKLDLTKPRSLAVSIGDEKLALEGSCFQLVLNRHVNAPTSPPFQQEWPGGDKPRLANDVQIPRPVVVFLEEADSSSHGQTVDSTASRRHSSYSHLPVRSCTPSGCKILLEDSTAAASSLVPTLILLFFGVLAVKVPAL